MTRKTKGVKHVHAPAGIKQQPVRIPVQWLLLILALTAVAYLPSLNGSFVWDDARYIENNPVAAGLVGTPEQYPWSSRAACDAAAAHGAAPQRGRI